MSEDRPWFAPKRFGYGAGLPIRWQGWALLIGYIALLAAFGFLLPYTVIGYISLVAMLTLSFLIVVARTTRGGWRWRWGDDD